MTKWELVIAFMAKLDRDMFLTFILMENHLGAMENYLKNIDRDYFPNPYDTFLIQ